MTINLLLLKFLLAMSVSACTKDIWSLKYKLVLSPLRKT